MHIAQSNYYSILGIPTPQTADDESITPEVLKSAYRKALLRHHPDRKAGEKVIDRSAKVDDKVTVDQIIEAYEVLADPTRRNKYHEDLLKRTRSALGKSGERSAFETFDLEELECREVDQGVVWERVCRCGGVYRISEKQLEEVAGDGEIVVGCRGCSLAIKIIFDVVDE